MLCSCFDELCNPKILLFISEMFMIWSIFSRRLWQLFIVHNIYDISLWKDCPIQLHILVFSYRLPRRESFGCLDNKVPIETISELCEFTILTSFSRSVSLRLWDYVCLVSINWIVDCLRLCWFRWLSRFGSFVCLLCVLWWFWYLSLLGHIRIATRVFGADSIQLGLTMACIQNKLTIRWWSWSATWDRDLSVIVIWERLGCVIDGHDFNPEHSVTSQRSNWAICKNSCTNNCTQSSSSPTITHHAAHLVNYFRTRAYLAHASSISVSEMFTESAVQ